MGMREKLIPKVVNAFFHSITVLMRRKQRFDPLTVYLKAPLEIRENGRIQIGVICIHFGSTGRRAINVEFHVIQ
eukprot:scaffold34305_cov41-Attheya_sp.AAC.1